MLHIQPQDRPKTVTNAYVNIHLQKKSLAALLKTETLPCDLGDKSYSINNKLQVANNEKNSHNE